MTKQLTHQIVDYWFDKTLVSYVPNTRQKFEINLDLSKNPPQLELTCDMTVLFYGSWGSNNDQTFCKIQIRSIHNFWMENVQSPMITESIWLLLKHQYQLAINVFRQQHYGTAIIACPIDVDAINKDVYEMMKQRLNEYLWFGENPPFQKNVNFYW
jgi:hypothetical protein